MGDYSTFKNGLDIIEALTKRLDRLTGFDSELDNILGGRQHDGGLDGVQFDQQFLANSPGSKTILQEHRYSQTTEYQWTSKLFCDVTSMNNQLIGITNCAPLSNHSFNVNDFSSTWANSNGGDFGPSTSYEKKPTNVPEPHYQKETKTSQIKSHSPWDKSGKFSFDTEIPDSSILRKFLETIDDESDSANRVCQNGEWNTTKVNGDYSDLIFDHDIDWTKASAMLEDTLEQHADLSIVDRSNLMIEQIQHMAHSKILTASKGVPKNGEHHQPILFHFEETVKDIGRNSDETFIQEFPPLLETHAERITKQLNLQPKVSPQPKGTFDSAAENQTFQTSLNPNDDQNKVDNQDNISADLDQDISAVLKGGPSSASVAESEEYFTASECSCTPTPSFQSAVDRESVLSWKSLSDFDYLDRSNFQSVTPGMKNLSELYMTSKSSNNLMDAYQSRLDPFKNAGILFEEPDKTQSHKHETGREISVPCTIQESFPTHQKENSFTMLEEVHHKHNLKLSPMEGCTLSTEELRSEYPINPRLDHTTKMTTVNEDFTKNVDKNLAFKDFTTNVDKDLIFNDFTRKVDENLTFKETRTVKKDLTNNFDEALTRNFHRDLTENFNKDFTRSFDKDLTRNFENEFTNNIDKDIGNCLVLRDTCDADISTNQSQSLTELITSAINGTGDPNSFSTIEEVKDIQHIKFSPLEGCSFNSQVTTTEFSPHDYLSLSAAREAMTSSEHTMLPSLQREHTRDVATLEDYKVHREDSQNEKYGEWNRDEVAMYNNEPQDPNSFSTIEEVKDIQHIKFSPLEGCSLNSQVTTTEFSPHDYLSLSATRQAVTSSEHAMLPSGPINSEATKDIVLLANNTMRNESMRDLATLLDEECHSTRSVNLALVPSHGKVHREYEDTLDVDKHRGWNRDEMAVYNPERSQDPNSFSTIEEVKDIQHIKFSPLEGCSFNSQVTTTEFSPRDYLMLHRVGEEKANEIEAAN